MKIPDGNLKFICITYWKWSIVSFLSRCMVQATPRKFIVSYFLPMCKFSPKSSLLHGVIASLFAQRLLGCCTQAYQEHYLEDPFSQMGFTVFRLIAMVQLILCKNPFLWLENFFDWMFLQLKPGLAGIFFFLQFFSILHYLTQVFQKV